jgi:hypothetical protein
MAQPLEGLFQSSARHMAQHPQRWPGDIAMEDPEIRAALYRRWAASDANDFEEEHQIYREDAVLEYPQSGERIRGRRNIQASRWRSTKAWRTFSMGSALEALKAASSANALSPGSAARTPCAARPRHRSGAPRGRRPS